MLERKAVVFDLDETLVDRRGSLDVYARELYERFRSSTELASAEFVAQFHRLDGHGRVPRERFFSDLAKEAFADVTPAQIAEHFQQNAWRAPRLFDGIPELLQSLLEEGWRVGIVTNGSVQSQSAKIDNSGLCNWVDCSVISAAFGSKKPDPAIFRHVIDRLDIEPARSWFVGDDPRADISGAKQVGFGAIWVERYSPWPDDLPRCYDARVTETIRAREHIH